MSNTVTIVDKYKAAGGNKVVKVFKILVSGSYLTSTTIGVAGETINFNAALNPNKIARPKIPSTILGSTANLVPSSQIKVVRAPDGYDAIIEQNAVSPTGSNYVMRIFTSGDTALGSGAYAAGVTADTTGFIVEVVVPLKND